MICRDGSRSFSIFESTRERSEEHTSELQSRPHLVCRLLLEKKNDDFEHVVVATEIPEVASFIDLKLITHHAPVACDCLFRFLVRIPVANRYGVTFYLHIAQL